MKIVIELTVSEDDEWATDPPQDLIISGARNRGHNDTKAAGFYRRGITGGRYTSIRYTG